MIKNRIAALATAWTVAWGACSAQVQCDGYAQRTNVDGEEVYLFTQGTAPVMSVKQSKTGDIIWTHSADGITTDTLRKSAGPEDKITIESEGLYSVETGDGTKASTWWLSPRPEAVSFIVDSADCEVVYVTASVSAPDLTFGTHQLRQSITFQWESGGDVVATSKSASCELADLYEKGALTVRAVNQAFNEAVFTDTVTPKAVRAEYEIENRKKEIANEATASGDAMSAPAEVALVNKSKGLYTVCEWEIGQIARLYDTDPVYQFQRAGTFTISLTITNEETGCASTDSSQTVTISDSALEFPNAFTPNGDGVNDMFLPSFRSLKKYKLTVYNRWGRRVFETSDPSDGWDGTTNGNKCAAGTYYYVASGEGYERGTSFNRKGSVTLIR